ncbi:MAG: ATP-dependent protease ATPase subunit HslU [Candidatus Cloacimonetes bacterium]|nr:ATP-dependent protease ATPase subunit HslU [Candidatus Cloacimonadota bacterium]
MIDVNILTPQRIVEELDKYIIGQNGAKRAVAIALRNRWRRQQIVGELQNEIIPNNIILIGPTGVGKTEIARRLSRLANAPFIKVEASKFTEIGYVGRDVESMIRELLDIAINQVRAEMIEKVQAIAKKAAFEKVLNKLIAPPDISKQTNETDEEYEERLARAKRSRDKMADKLLSGELDDREIEIQVEDAPKVSHVEVFSNVNMETMDFNIGDMLNNIVTGNNKKKTKKLKVPEALELMSEIEAANLVKKEEVIRVARERVETSGIIFIDEIDKIADGKERYGADVSRSGVQRDLLPIVEGSNVPTKHGMINTAHILFIAAGAFHMSKPSDLIPELQGRFPIREELSSLSVNDFERILVEPETALTKQYIALFETEGVKLSFESKAIKVIAEYAFKANEMMEDIGARRLQTILNHLLEDYLYRMPDKKIKRLKITEQLVQEKLSKIIENEDLSKFIL